MKCAPINGAVYKKKMASFDYDWTLVCPKNGNTFPKDVDDWKLLYPNIPGILKSYHEKDYMIVIFTNQSKDWKIEQIYNVMKSMNLPLFIVIAFKDKEEYKPNVSLFNNFIDLEPNFLIDKGESFYVGDALGRKGDWSDSDKLFADNIGIKCISPEDMFHVQEEIIIPEIPLSDGNELIIMMGYPGSGKTTIAKHICSINDNYVVISGDEYNTIPKVKKKCIEYIADNKSIILDATNSSSKKRKEYVNLSIKYNYNVKCIHVRTSLEESYKRNKFRDSNKHVPKIAYNVYKKHYEEPLESEGFTLIII